MKRPRPFQPAVRCVAGMLPAFLAVCGVAACAGPRQAVSRSGIAEASALHPMVLGTDPFLAAPSGGLEGPKPERDRAARGGSGVSAGAAAAADGHAGAEGTLAAGGSAATGGAMAASSTVPSMVPARGEARGEMVASIVRLLGISGSFDDRSFLGHVLRVNDLLPPGASAPTYPASEALRRAKAAGALRPADTGRPGDVLFFRCGSGCGVAGSDGLSAGIVESVDGGTVRVVAYVEGVVRRCVVGPAAGGSREPRLEGVAGVADPWVLRAQAR